MPPPVLKDTQDRAELDEKFLNQSHPNHDNVGLSPRNTDGKADDESKFLIFSP